MRTQKKNKQYQCVVSHAMHAKICAVEISLINWIYDCV